MASLNEIRRLVAQVKRYNLSAPESFHAAPLELLRGMYNGIGPEAWSAWWRGKVTQLLRLFSSVALVHDYEFATAPRTYWAFTIANVRFAYNAYTLARGEAAERLAQLQTWAPNTARADEVKVTARRTIRAGLLLAVICQLGGWRGYRDEFIIKKGD